MKLNISFTDFKQNALFQLLSDTLEEKGMKGYVVGGYVRDHILGRGFKKDIDVVTLGSGIEFAQAVQKKLKGAQPVKIFKTYGTAMIHWKGIELEFVGARKESYAKESRNPTVNPGSLEDDQNRRDFTINALAVSLNRDDFGTLIDPFMGVEDLKKQIIRTPLNPDITYSDDPLRMLRAIRFATQLHFTIAPKSFEAIQRNAERIDIISQERIVDELHKIIDTPKPSIGFRLLEESNLLERILPEVTALKGVDEIEGQTHKDNFYHTLEVVDNLCQKSENRWLRWAALLHDIGKASTKKFKPPTGWTFHNHEFVGSKMVYSLFKRLKMPLNEKMKYVQKIVMMSSRPIVIAEDFVTDSAIRRLLFDAGDDIDDLLTMCEADITTKNPRRFEKYMNNFTLVREKIVQLEEKDHLRNFQPPISGEVIMTYFGLTPCPQIGQIKEAIKEAILEGEIPNAYDAAFEKMKVEGIKLGLKANG
jgi:poly(A) polymerase